MKSCCLCVMTALGLGLVVIGVIVTMWNRDSPTSKHHRGTGSPEISWSGVSLCIGIAFLLLSLIFSIQKIQCTRGEQQSSDGVPSSAGGGERQREAECFAVPSYEEVVDNDQYTVGHLSEPNYCTTDLPAYEDVMVTDCGTEFSDKLCARPAQTRQDAHGSVPQPALIRRNETPGLVQEPITPPPQYDALPPELHRVTLTSCSLNLK
ncbi:transmembrane protein 51-like [Brachyhypopomus gauderio]|uniref:transmembrane protein 51-like n=1 Tax=Brachyhypopomus gauderio TaxID=698409 RepID=UPI00404291FC